MQNGDSSAVKDVFSLQISGTFTPSSSGLFALGQHNHF